MNGPFSTFSASLFRKKFKELSAGECWNWDAYKDVDGYGCFYPAGEAWRAHRYAWRLEYGRIKRDLLVCHTCDNPSCVNPSHLFQGSFKDNMQDKLKKGRHRCGEGVPSLHRGEKHHSSKVTIEAVLEIRKLYSLGGISFANLGARFGLKGAATRDIVRRETWRHVL